MTTSRSATTRSASRSSERARRAALLGAAWLSLASRGVAAPWAEGVAPTPEGALSVEILGPDEPLYQAPAAGAARRGAAARGALLPLYGARHGSGCEGRWLLVGALAWVCERRVRLSPREPLPPRTAGRHTTDGLPFTYFFVGSNGAFGWPRLSTAEDGQPASQLEPGFAVAVRELSKRADGELFALTTKNVWVPLRDLGRARPMPELGVLLGGSALPKLAWPHDDRTRPSERPGGTARGEPLERYRHYAVEEELVHGGHRWLRLAPGWVEERDLRVLTSGAAPNELEVGERWIDVDQTQQTLVAWEGTRPVFAALVSTGRGRAGTEQATPTGTHRLWIKLRSGDMDNLESTTAGRLYAMQEVPWVMYFLKGYGLHGTFWHRSFGNVRSHGCVNLTPRDAEWLFDWTSPRLPAGWTAVLPTRYERGTLVRVRGTTNAR